jgi:hypothetical protein
MRGTGKPVVYVDKEKLAKVPELILSKEVPEGLMVLSFFPHIHPKLRPVLLETLLNILS